MADHTQTALHFDEVDVGDSWQSPGRTVTETDIVNFACLTGDFDPLHVNHRFASETPFGKPIAHGLLGLSFVAGLSIYSPMMSTAAFVRIADWKFLQPIFVGDTVHVITQVLEKESRGRRHGLIRWQRRLLNEQTGAVIQEGIFETLVRTAAAAKSNDSKSTEMDRSTAIDQERGDRQAG